MGDSTMSISPALASVIWESPADIPPPGTVANFTDPPNYWIPSIAVLVVQSVVIAIALGSRLCSTIFVRGKLRLDDLFAYTGLAFYIAVLVPATVGVGQGFGVDIWNMTYGALSHLLFLANICEIMYGLSLLFIKLSILFHLKRLFAPQRLGNEVMWYTIWGLVVAHILFYAAHDILIIAACNPRPKIWDPVLDGTCINIQALIFAAATVNAVSDFTIILIPILRVWKLHLAKNYKLNLTIVFATGALGCICSIMRAYYSWLFLQSTDVTRTIYWMGFWAELEIVAGFFASAVPFMPRCYNEMGPRIRCWLQLRTYHASRLGTLESGSRATASVDRDTKSLTQASRSQADAEAGRPSRDKYTCVTVETRQNSGQSAHFSKPLPHAPARAYAPASIGYYGNTGGAPQPQHQTTIWAPGASKRGRRS